MSLTARVKAVFKSNMNRPPARAEDPRDLLDESYERQVELLQDVRRGLAEVATAKKRIELQAAELAYAPRPARRPGVRGGRAAAGRPRAHRPRRAARRSNRRWRCSGSSMPRSPRRKAQLIANQQRLAERIETFRIKKDAFKATYTASEAQARANEAIAGLGGEMVAATQTLQHAQDADRPDARPRARHRGTTGKRRPQRLTPAPPTPTSTAASPKSPAPRRWTSNSPRSSRTSSRAAQGRRGRRCRSSW